MKPSWEERQFYSEGAGYYLLIELHDHLRCGDLQAARSVAEEIRAAARAYGLKRYEGVPCGRPGHQPWRMVSQGHCQDCAKEAGKRRTAAHKRDREEAKRRTQERIARMSS